MSLLWLEAFVFILLSAAILAQPVGVDMFLLERDSMHVWASTRQSDSFADWPDAIASFTASMIMWMHSESASISDVVCGWLV